MILKTEPQGSKGSHIMRGQQQADICLTRVGTGLVAFCAGFLSLLEMADGGVLRGLSNQSEQPPNLPSAFLHRLIWEVWMPFVRNIVTQWQPRNCDPMVDFLDSWVHIIPVWILDNILDQLIFPKLQKEVRQSVGNCCHWALWRLV